VEGLLTNTIIPSTPCAGCAYGKHRRSPFPTGRIRATYTGQLIHSDLCGPMEKSRRMPVFRSFHRRLQWLSFHILLEKKKSEATTRFKDLINMEKLGISSALSRQMVEVNGLVMNLKPALPEKAFVTRGPSINDVTRQRGEGVHDSVM
jgi:hypothetical protein